MEGAPAEAAVVSYVEPPPPRSWLGSPWLIVLLLGGVFVVTVPVALYWWLNQGEDEVVSRVPAAVQVDPVPLPLAGPVAKPAEIVAPAVEPEPASLAAPKKPAAPEPAPELTATPASGSGELGAASASSGANGVLNLEFGAESWVEIKDVSGRMLHRQLNPAGSSVSVRGQPPFELVIGNAAQARMTYNGRPIDLTPFIGTTVARFTLEE
jgi:cytoskeleton protein RodZ